MTEWQYDIIIHIDIRRVIIKIVFKVILTKIVNVHIYVSILFIRLPHKIIASLLNFSSAKFQVEKNNGVLRTLGLIERNSSDFIPAIKGRRFPGVAKLRA